MSKTGPKLIIRASFFDKFATMERPIMLPIPPNRQTPLITRSRSLLRNVSIVKARRGISTEIMIVSKTTTTAKSKSCRNVRGTESKLDKMSKTSATRIKVA